MTVDDYEKWMEHHKALFQMHTDADQKMFVAWWPLLRGYALAELLDASNHLVTREVKTFKTEQLAAIRMRITQRRHEKFQAECAQDSFLSTACEMCGNTGFAIVPHLAFVIDGQWQPLGNSFPTVSVHCSCSKGARLHEAVVRYGQENEGKRKKDKQPVVVQLTLAGYEQKNQRWRDQVRDRESMLLEEEEAHQAAMEASGLEAAPCSRRLEDVINRLADKFGIKGRSKR